MSWDLGFKLGDRAGRVVGVRRVPLERRVEDTDVEVARHGCRIADRKVVLGCRSAKALAVDCDLKPLDPMGFRFARGEDVDVWWQGQLLGDFALGVVVAIDDEDRNTGPVQASHLPYEVAAGVVVAPVAVVKIAGDDQEIDLLFDR